MLVLDSMGINPCYSLHPHLQFGNSGLKFQRVEFSELHPSILWWHLEGSPHNSAWGHLLQDVPLSLRLH